MARLFRLPAPPRDRPYSFEDLDRLLAGHELTFDELAAALVLVVPPVEALMYLRVLSERRALHPVGTDHGGTRIVAVVGDGRLAAC